MTSPADPPDPRHDSRFALSDVDAAEPSGDVELDLRFAYSATEPRLEIIRSVPGSLWVPAPGSGIHHLGYWSDDVEHEDPFPLA